MCRFIKPLYTACEHTDHDGRQVHRELGFIRYCDDARKLADDNCEKTKLCEGTNVEDMPIEYEYVEGMCRKCYEAKGRRTGRGTLKGLKVASDGRGGSDVGGWMHSVAKALKW
jgi:hypothetical protein